MRQLGSRWLMSQNGRSAVMAENETTRTGSYPAVPDRPSPPPVPEHGTPAWYNWATERIRATAKEATRALDVAKHLSDQLGRPPIPAAKDPGAGLWLLVADVRTDCTQILAKLDQQDKTAEKRGGWVGRIGWRVIDILVAAGVTWLIVWLSGHWR